MLYQRKARQQAKCIRFYRVSYFNNKKILLIKRKEHYIYLTLIKNRFNASTISRDDPTLHSISHKYGKETWPKPHPCINEQPWSSTFRQSYKQPTTRFRPNHRTKSTIASENFDASMKE